MLCGTGPADQQYKQQARQNGIGQHVHFTGYLDRKSLANIYAAGDLNLVPYWREEGSPAVPFEALIAGTPSVVAKGCGADELIARWDAGWIWDPQTPIAPCIEQALQQTLNGESKAKVQRGRQAVRQELSWRHYVAEVEKQFRSALP